jgi:hypothetical protein
METGIAGSQDNVGLDNAMTSDPAHRVLPEDYHLPPDDLANGYHDQLIETTRKWLALHKQFPDCLIRFRRAAPKRQKDNPNRRFLLRCELDAAFFHLYGISRARWHWQANR